jgi:hypothetical protein
MSHINRLPMQAVWGEIEAAMFTMTSRPNTTLRHYQATSAPVVTLENVTAVLLVVPNLPRCDVFLANLTGVEVKPFSVCLKLVTGSAEPELAQITIEVPRTAAFELALSTAAWQGRLLIAARVPAPEDAFTTLAFDLGEGHASIGDALLRTLSLS